MTEPPSAAEPPAPLTPQEEAAKAAANRAANFKIGAVAFALLLCCVGAVVKGTSTNGSDTPDVDRSNAAISTCEDSVKSQLKAPSTAKFSDERYTDNDPSWLVTGSVDAENSFGAMIRNSFRCEMTRSGEAFIVTSSNIG